MKIGIIVYSLSNHTLSVAVKVQEKLAAAGHAVTLERIEIEGQAVHTNESAALKTMPDTAPYDAVIFGSPVRGGVLPPPVQRYFDQVDSLGGKKTAILVTGFFPYKWGRMQVTGQMREILEKKDAHVCGIGSVGWFSLNRRAQIRTAVRELSNCLKA
jgi:flavodoxin